MYAQEVRKYLILPLNLSIAEEAEICNTNQGWHHIEKDYKTITSIAMDTAIVHIKAAIAEAASPALSLGSL